MAGSKTTTDALAITFAFLGNHPEWVKSLQDDLDKVVGKERDPKLEDALLLPRVEAFIAEVCVTYVYKFHLNLMQLNEVSKKNLTRDFVKHCSSICI